MSKDYILKMFQNINGKESLVNERIQLRRNVLPKVSNTFLSSENTFWFKKKLQPTLFVEDTISTFGVLERRNYKCWWNSDKPRERWTDAYKAKNQLNSSSIIFRLCFYAQVNKVHDCAIAKEIWNTLVIAHEGTI